MLRPNRPIDCSLVLVKSGDKFLGVSRKDNHNDIGLPGGKRNPGESFKDCAIREVMEETGYVVKLISCTPYDDIDLGYRCLTYLAEFETTIVGDKGPGETGLVGFFDKQDFLDGSFGRYNADMFKHFNL